MAWNCPGRGATNSLWRKAPVPALSSLPHPFNLSEITSSRLVSVTLAWILQLLCDAPCSYIPSLRTSPMPFPQNISTQTDSVHFSLYISSPVLSAKLQLHFIGLLGFPHYLLTFIVNQIYVYIMPNLSPAGSENSQNFLSSTSFKVPFCHQFKKPPGVCAFSNPQPHLQ